MTQGTASLSRLLEFFAPGIIHGLGNSLFAIHGNAQVLGEVFERERTAILSASVQAQHMLEVLRCLSAQGPLGGSVLEVRAVLPAICDACRVSMRDFGVAVHLQEDIHTDRAGIDVVLAVRAVGAAMLAIRDRLPSGYEGSVQLGVVSHRKRAHEIVLDLVHKPSFLPFPVDFDGVRSAADSFVPGVFLAPEPGDSGRVRIDVRQK